MHHHIKKPHNPYMHQTIAMVANDKLLIVTIVPYGVLRFPLRQYFMLKS